jgi:hypothetical protein
MQLTKRQEKQLTKVFNDPKKLRKWVDEVFLEMKEACKKQTNQLIDDYLNLYSITVAFTLSSDLGLGKKRLPEIMERIWKNLDCFKSGHLNIDDCIMWLQEKNIDFSDVIKEPGRIQDIKENVRREG